MNESERDVSVTTITAAQAKLLNEIQIPVTVEIGELLLTGAQVVDLLAGQLFEFMFDAQKPLALKVGAETIAFARFVVEEERLVLEIVELIELEKNGEEQAGNFSSVSDDRESGRKFNTGGELNGTHK